MEAVIIYEKFCGKKVFMHEGIGEEVDCMVLSEYETGGKITMTYAGGKIVLLKKCRDLIQRVGEDVFINTINKAKETHGIVNT